MHRNLDIQASHPHPFPPFRPRREGRSLRDGDCVAFPTYLPINLTRLVEHWRNACFLPSRTPIGAIRRGPHAKFGGCLPLPSAAKVEGGCLFGPSNFCFLLLDKANVLGASQPMAAVVSVNASRGLRLAHPNLPMQPHSNHKKRSRNPPSPSFDRLARFGWCHISGVLAKEEVGWAQHARTWPPRGLSLF